MSNTETIVYRVFEETIEIDGAGLCTVFGIAAFGADPGAVLRAGNISPHREDAERFAGLCNGLGLSPTHFFEALDDYLIMLLSEDE